MDDMYLIHRDKEYLKYCLQEIIKFCDTLKIKVHMRKTQIMPLKHGLIYLKGRYQLLESGKILRRPCKASTKRMKRKLKKFKGLLAEKRMNYADLRSGYQSWRGNFRRRFKAYRQLKHVDRLYNSLLSPEKDLPPKISIEKKVKPRKKKRQKRLILPLEWSNI